MVNTVVIPVKCSTIKNIFAICEGLLGIEIAIGLIVAMVYSVYDLYMLNAIGRVYVTSFDGGSDFGVITIATHITFGIIGVVMLCSLCYEHLPAFECIKDVGDS